MNFFNLFKSDPKPDVNFSTLATDIHSHLIPGIDDGVQSLDESLELIQGLKDLGYQRLITTPHIMADYYPNTSREILDGLRRVRKALQQARIAIQLDAAAEYLMDEQFEEKIEKEELLTLTGKLVLVEMGFVDQPPNLANLLFRLQTKGYTPIMAHPERYRYYNGEIEKFKWLKERGCRLQVNLLSLTGHYGSGVQRTAEKLLQEGLVDYLGTDLHRKDHLEELREALQSRKFTKQLTAHAFDNATLTTANL